ncbi:MAG: hypothetical protein K8E66_01485, partial [Phycisphaerales bacterium]|nr:hypothetical protein [Phycisphaerales bacterium]
VYWNRYTQRAPEQWAPQPLHRVGHPSGKGMMYQVARYDILTPQASPSMACCTADLPPTAVLWADLSAETFVIGTLKTGEPNYFHHSGPGYGSYNETGPPILNTKDGVLGRDR